MEVEILGEITDDFEQTNHYTNLMIFERHAEAEHLLSLRVGL